MLEIADSLKPGDFYKPANAKVYSAIQRLYEQSQPIDILTVSEELERRGQIEEIGVAPLSQISATERQRRSTQSSTQRLWSESPCFEA